MIKNISHFLTNYFPLAFCLSICSGFGTVAALVISCLSILLMPELKPKKLMPFVISFLIIGYMPGNRFFTSLIFGVLLLIYSLFFDKLNNKLFVFTSSGIMLAGALTSTVLFTTLYFGIGASGKNVTEMIRSYISLGFHPNWRGVLFGTIVLVLIITFPRKFKTVSKYISAPFLALLITLIINLFLNPSDMVSAITEIPRLNSEHLIDYIQSEFHSEIKILSVLNGIALFILFISSFSSDNEISKKDYLIYSGTNIISCGIFSLPLPYGINKNKDTIIPRIISIIILCAAFLLFEDYVARIPLHSCAVVIIVSAWENVRWIEIKKSFSKISTVFIFIISFIFCMLSNISIGIIISFVLNILIHQKRPAE